MAPATALAPHLTGITYLLARRAFTQRLHALTAMWAYLGPGHGQCPRCHAEVLIVGGETPLEPVPVLAEYPCPQCLQVANKGDERRMQCWRCGGRRTIGEPLPKVGVAIDPSGVARPFTGRRHDGEAVHRHHVCAGA